MRIGSVFLPERGATDVLLAEVATRLMAGGVAVAGAVQHSTGCAVNHCDMDLQVLPDGPIIRISQNLGAGSSGCRLDAGALEVAVMQVTARLDGARLLVVNKFGKHESEGRGFRAMIADCLAEGVPVLIGTNSMNLTAFAEFTDGLAEEIAPDLASVMAWCDEVLAGEVHVKEGV